MATFSQCPRCNCKDEGTTIYKCNGCNKIFCDVCSNSLGNCPRCDCVGGRLGEVQNEDDDD
jgi:hypothetical protein